MSKKVFYFMNEQSYWIDIVKKLEKEKQWKPVLWVTNEVLQPSIKEEFPLTKIIDLQNHRRGEYKVESVGLDQNIIEKYILSEKNVLSMMNRMDPTRNNFSYQERLHLYYKMLSYWIKVFEDYKPDLVMFDEVPHVPFEYIMHEVACMNNIKIIRLNPIHINNRFLLLGQINKTPDYIRKRYLENINQDEILLSDDMKQYYINLTKNYHDAEPIYMKKDVGLKKIKWFFSAINFVLFKKGNYSYFRVKNGYLNNAYFRKIINIYNIAKSILFKQKLLRKYKSLVSYNVNLKSNYIYVPLHYQPERTSSPEAGIYNHQWLMIQLLSNIIPSDWILLVKEHRSQFNLRASGQMGRYIDYYNELLEIDNVKLVPLEYNSFDLIDNSKAIATITGTVGIESVVRGHPVLVFGNPWYQDCEGVFNIKYKKDLEDFFQKIDNITIDKHKVLAFFKTLDDCSLIADNIKKDIIENIFRLIDKWEIKIG